MMNVMQPENVYLPPVSGPLETKKKNIGDCRIALDYMDISRLRINIGFFLFFVFYWDHGA